MTRSSEARSMHSFRELVTLSIASQISEAAFGVFSVAGLAVGAAIAAVALPGTYSGVRIALLTLLTIAVAWVAFRLMRLHALAMRGVEVDADLVGVADVPKETSSRVATYRYEYAGRTYFVKCVALDFQMSSATRYGRSAVALVDPEHPGDAMLLRPR